MAAKKDKVPTIIGSNSEEPELIKPGGKNLFQPGNKYGGRPKGSRSKLSEAVILDILADWEVAGPSAIQACRLDNPGVYLRVVASLIPKEFKFNPGTTELDAILEQLNPEQLAQFHGALAAYSDAAQSQPRQIKEGTGN